MNFKSLRTRSWGFLRLYFLVRGDRHVLADLYQRRRAMIVIMKPGSTEAQLEHVKKRVREMRLKDHVSVGTERTLVAGVGSDRFKDRKVLETVEGVERVVPILAPYKMASKEVKKERSLVPLIGDVRVGGRRVQVIAGPCSVENKQQLLETAHAVKSAGAT